MRGRVTIFEKVVSPILELDCELHSLGEIKRALVLQLIGVVEASLDEERLALEELPLGIHLMRLDGHRISKHFVEVIHSYKFI